jgi:hypothetical protein
MVILLGYALYWNIILALTYNLQYENNNKKGVGVTSVIMGMGRISTH